jgi:hypothetical protein
VGHEQVPALYDQSLGKFYFRPGAPAAPPASGSGPAVASPAIHVPSAAELDESYWQGIRQSADPSDFTSYTKSFPKGMHVAEAEMMTRKLTRTATATKPAAASTPAATPARETIRPGSYQGFITTNRAPGQVFPGTWTFNQDGSVDSTNTYGDRGHALPTSADPNNLSTRGISRLGIFGGVQRRYPDGSTSTQVMAEGRLLNGILTGTWHDKFQAGQFQVNVGSGP